MSSNQQYKSINALAQAIQNYTQQIEAGNLGSDDMDRLLADTRELYDRLVVLRYKAFESSVKGTSDTNVEAVTPAKEEKAATETEAPIEAEPETEAPNLFKGFKLDFAESNAVKPAKKNVVSKKTKVVPGKQESIPVPDQPLPFNNPNPPKKVEKPIEPKVEIEEVVHDENQIDLISAIDDNGPMSINEKLAAQKEGENLASQLASQPISDLKTAIGINQKFLFMNDLFNGEHAEYHKAIDIINNMSNEQEAVHYVTHDLAKKFNWDMESISVDNFFNLVNRRF